MSRGATTPAYCLGRFRLDETEAICSAPGCLGTATTRVAWVYKAEIVAVELCESCGAVADERPVRQIDAFSTESTSLAYVVGDGCARQGRYPPAA